MNTALTSPAGVAGTTRVRYGVLGLACSLSMITYLDRVCFGTVAPYIQREFELNDVERALLFTAFALAYACFEVPTGWLGDIFGPRKTLIRIVLWWSTFTVLTGLVFPVASLPWFAFVAMLTVRFLFGIGEAGAYPNLARALHNWFPFAERGSAQGAVWMAGRFAGGITPLIVLALLVKTPREDGVEFTTPYKEGKLVITITGNVANGKARVDEIQIVEKGVEIGKFANETAVPDKYLDQVKNLIDLNVHQTYWRHTFWIFGALGVGWCLIFWWWFRDRPEQHKGVNEAELAWIRAGNSPVSQPSPSPHTPLEGEPAPGAVPADEQSHAGVPWRKVLTNRNLWILCLMYFCGAYGWYFNITYLPGYLEETYGLHKGETWSAEFWTLGLMAGLPLLFGSLACLAGGLLTDLFIRRTGNRKWGRRLFGMVGHGTCAICYFVSLAAPNVWLFALAVAAAAFCNDLTMGAAWASCLDIGRKYSGIVSGCMNTVGNLGGAVAGYTTGLVLHAFADNRALGWQINFLSFGAIYVVAVGLWMCFDSTRPVVQEEH